MMGKRSAVSLSVMMIASCFVLFFLALTAGSSWAASPSIHAAAPPASVSAGQADVAAGEFCAAPDEVGRMLPLRSIIPFAGILLSIALFPLQAPTFWHQHYPTVSAFWAIVFAVPFVYRYQGVGFYKILHIYVVDYTPFIILVGTLFTIARRYRGARESAGHP